MEETRKYASGTTGEGKLSRRVGGERRHREKKNAKNLIHFINVRKLRPREVRQSSQGHPLSGHMLPG